MPRVSRPANQYDLIVCGGGPSGVMAAISAARQGVKTLLLERHGFLGGMNTAALVGPIMTFHAGKAQIVRGIPGEIMDRLKERGGTPGHLVDPIWANTSMTPVDTEIYKPLLIEEVKRAGVELLLHSLVMDGVRDGERIRKIRVASKDGLQELSADYFIDATGDGDLAARLGCEFTTGRGSDGLTQPMTLMFKMCGVDEALVRDAIRRNPTNFYLGFPVEQYLALPGLGISGFYQEVARGKEAGLFPFDRDRVLFFGLTRPGEVSINTLRIARVNGTHAADLTRAESELRMQVPVLVNFLREFIPGFKNAFVSETAAQIGVRETRHIHGLYTLTAQNIFNQTRFEDSIAHASYPIDIHSPDGKGMSIVDPRKERPESFYSIPLRSLIPLRFTNLLVTGRCISAEHEASASARISATCMALGQAAGAAVREAQEQGVASFAELMPAPLQARLIQSGHFLER